ncbi:MAG: sulfotransferase [Gammaproteobacteria bacterium]|nr:sulfotransferase [Gammaproteobacteria bacterium]
MSAKKPNFFIIGAPKCGTTSLDAWLKSHPRIFTAVKEPNYFNTRGFGMTSASKYEALFAGATDRHLAIGEASPKYLRCPDAVANILRYNRQARFIVMVRNPVDMAASFHWQQIREENENMRDFETAWNLQDKRRAGAAIPRMCYDRANLLYGDVCSLGGQLARVYEQARPERVHVVVFDDLKRDPAGVYRSVLKFLRVSDDHMAVFDVHNPGRVPRVPCLNRMMDDALGRLARVKAALGIRRRFNSSAWVMPLKRFNTRIAPHPPLTPDFRRALVDYFADDVRLLESLIGRDLSHWSR